jgi:hypothetical protein
LVLTSKNPLFWIVTDLRESLAIIFERFVTPYWYMSQLFFLEEKLGKEAIKR